MDVIKKLGPFEVALCGLSYLRASLKRKGNEENLEQWVSNRFGWRLYSHFFKGYTEKVWGVPDDRAARRVGRAAHQGPELLVGREVRLPRQQGQQDQVADRQVPVPALRPGPDVGDDDRADRGDGRRGPARDAGHEASSSRTAASSPSHAGDEVIEPASRHLVAAAGARRVGIADPRRRPRGRARRAKSLRYRDFLTVALILDGEDLFPDNWIYIHEDCVQVGRIQNYRSWSPWMVPDPDSACVGMEYFCFEGDELWNMSDDDLVALATPRARAARASARPIARAPRLRRAGPARPIRCTTSTTPSASTTIRSWLDPHATTSSQVGRNGLHRYNNSDHSMLSAMRAVDNVLPPPATTSGPSTSSRPTTRSRPTPTTRTRTRAARARRRGGCRLVAANAPTLAAPARPRRLAGANAARRSRCRSPSAGRSSRSPRWSGGRATSSSRRCRRPTIALAAPRRRARALRARHAAARRALAAPAPRRRRRLHAHRRLRADHRRLHGQQRAAGARGRPHEGRPHAPSARTPPPRDAFGALVAERLLDAAALALDLRRARATPAACRSGLPGWVLLAVGAGLLLAAVAVGSSAAAPRPRSACRR